MTESHRADASSAGCWIDGHWGQYAVARMVLIAEEHGRPQDDLTLFAYQHLASMGPSEEPGLKDDEFDALMDAADDVEAWMNEYVAPEGFSFGWADGEFFLWSDKQWESGDLY